MTQEPGPQDQPPDPYRQPSPYGAPPPAYGPPPPAYGPPPAAYGNAPAAGYAPLQAPGPGPRAGMGRRLVARIIDAVLLGAVLVAIAIPTGVFSTLTNQATGNTSGIRLNVAINGVSLLLGALYEIGLVSWRGATLGKMALGIRIVDLGTGVVPTVGAASLRWLIPALGSFVCGVGQLLVYVSPFFDGSGRQQGWHDKVAKTMVISG